MCGYWGLENADECDTIVIGRDLCEPLEMQAEKEGRPQLVVCSRDGYKPG